VLDFSQDRESLKNVALQLFHGPRREFLDWCLMPNPSAGGESHISFSLVCQLIRPHGFALLRSRLPGF
jgi:hypothetical protein